VFINRLPNGISHLGKRLISYSQPLDGPIEMTFTDGTTATCDVMIGCDGIKSAVRRHMYQQKVDAGQAEMVQYIAPVFTGEVNYRCVVPTERLPTGHSTLSKPMIVSDG
jgi:salicylate hydroxylase